MVKHVINNPSGRKPLSDDEKMGAPISMRYTGKQMRRLKRKAGTMPLCAYIRESSLNAIVRLPVSKELMKEIRDLNNLGTNINLLAKSARTAGYKSIAYQCLIAAEGVCKVLHEARVKIKPKEEEDDSLLNR